MTELLIKKPSTLADALSNTGHSRTKTKQLIKHRAIKVNGKIINRADLPLVIGDLVSIGKGNKNTQNKPGHGIKLIYEDSDLVVIEKPAGLLTIASEKEKVQTAYYLLNEFLQRRAGKNKERVFIVHRLDKDTSGLILFAKTERIKRALQDKWKKVEKLYYAVVEGIPRNDEGVIESNLKESKALKVHTTRNYREGKPSKTIYKVIKKSVHHSLLEIGLETGRKNQIRAHLSSLGHPVAGDRKYGAKTNPFRRLGLHAYMLSFTHPISGKAMKFESKVPGEFRFFS